MSEVEYLCSIGIRVILQTYKEAKKKGRKLGIEHPSECVKKVLYITALNELLMI
jgi:anti-anti-sigma factor